MEFKLPFAVRAAYIGSVWILLLSAIIYSEKGHIEWLGGGFALVVIVGLVTSQYRKIAAPTINPDADLDHLDNESHVFPELGARIEEERGRRRLQRDQLAADKESERRHSLIISVVAGVLAAFSFTLKPLFSWLFR